MSHATAMAPPTDNEHHNARAAFTLMETHQVVPSPENYAVWFNYAVEKNKDLNVAIDGIIKNKLKFTPDTCAYLYNKYIVTSRNQKVLDDSAIAAQKVLQDVLRVVSDFSGEQQNYNQDVDQYL